MRILVVGATGRQGGGVARHLLRRGGFAVRAMTRHTGSPAAGELRRRGAEVIEGDLANRAALRTALKDCDGAFGITAYAEHLEREEALGMNLINAVSGSSIEHFVLSGLPAIDAPGGATGRSRQCEIKARLEAYARSLQLPATYLHASPYFESLPAIAARCAPRDRARTTAAPQRGLPAIAAEDIGGIVAGIFARPDPGFNRTITAVADVRTLDEYVALFAHGPAVPAGRPESATDTRRTPLDDLMPLVCYMSGRGAAGDELAEARALHPEMHSFESWLRAVAVPA